MSPPSSRAQARRQRTLVISLVVVIVVAFGSLAATLAAQWSPRLGLDLAGGFSVVYQPVHPHSVSTTDLQETVDILTNRVNGLGVSGATVGTQKGSNGTNIVVSVPGVKDAQQVLKTIGKVGQLYFRPALCYAPPYSPPKSTTSTTAPTTPPTTCATPKAQLVTTNLQGSVSSATGVFYADLTTPTLAKVPTTKSDDPKATVLLPGLSKTTDRRYLLGPAELTGHAVKKAVAQQTQLGNWVVNITLTSEGQTGWNAMAKKYF